MATKIIVNLPVKDLNRSVTFFTKLGYKFNQQFTDEKATCMIVAEDIFVMLLREDFFKTFTKKPVVDAKKMAETLVCFSAESKEDVNVWVHKAVSAGALVPNPPTDQGFMYGWGFEDLDGHLWEIMWMDPGILKKG